MNAIAEKIATPIDPRITAYIAKFRYSTTSPSSAPQLRSYDSRILAYIAKYPLKPASEATTSLARPEPLFQPRRRPNLFVQTPDYVDLLKGEALPQKADSEPILL